MAITATSEGGATFEPIPAGSYAARCFEMIHIGTVSEEYMGQMKENNKVRISWELPTEMKSFKDGEAEKPQVISKDYVLSMYEKANLRKHLEGWRGKNFTEDEAKAFDVTKLLGVECMLSIIHKQSKKGKVYAEISSISRLPKGMTCPKQINPSFEFSYDSFTEEKFQKLPEWIRKQIITTPEYASATSVTSFSEDKEDLMQFEQQRQIDRANRDNGIQQGLVEPEEESDLPF